ncbi:MAG: STAS domain-containing protein, partial [bacterium]
NFALIIPGIYIYPGIMKIKFTKGKQICTIFLQEHEGRIADNYMDFYEGIVNSAKSEKIYIDLSDVKFFSTIFIGQLVKFRNNFPVDYKKVEILNPNPDIHEVLKIAGMDKIYRIAFKN